MLDRLLRAAARARPEMAEVPPGLETRVLAHWRAGARQDESLFLFAFLRRAALGAAMALALT